MKREPKVGRLKITVDMEFGEGAMGWWKVRLKRKVGGIVNHIKGFEC